jgi:hypothetical protein
MHLGLGRPVPLRELWLFFAHMAALQASCAWACEKTRTTTKPILEAHNESELQYGR